MREMTRRERILAASRGQTPDRLPFFHYWRHSQIGWAERACRNRGMGMSWLRPCYTQRLHGVEVSERQAVVDGRAVARITYATPVGEVYQDEYREAGVGQWHGSRSWRDISPWQTSRLIKGPDDYRVMQYIVEHTEYVADDFPIAQATEWLGEEGVVVAGLPHSPMQTLLIDWIGSEGGRCFYHLADYPDLVEGLYEALCRCREPLDAIAARCPAPVVLCGDNIDGQLVSPPLFRRYFMPVYERQARGLHAHPWATSRWARRWRRGPTRRFGWAFPALSMPWAPRRRGRTRWNCSRRAATAGAWSSPCPRRNWSPTRTSWR